MKNVFAIVALLLLGCTLFVSAPAAGEIMTCGGSNADKAEPNIAITSENGGCCGETESVASKENTPERRSYKITNTGNVKLTNVRVMDARFSNINCQETNLDVGQSMTCVAHDLVSGADLKKKGGACATGDHITVKEAGVQVTTKGDCDSGA